MKTKSKISKRKVLNLLFWIFVVATVVFIIPATLSKDSSTICKKIDITIQPKSDLFFVEEEHVLEAITDANDGASIIGESKKNLNLHDMEKSLMANGYLENASVFQRLNGDLEIEVQQKIPVVRIINKNMESYYLDKNNKKIPYNKDFAPRLLVASGAISETYEDSTSAKSTNLQNISKVVQFIIQNTLWKAQIEQLYVDKLGRIYLIPKIGSHTIVLGSATDLEEKFEKLLAFYKGGLGQLGWEKYKTIDLRFKNQIVAKKR